jgi:hypothetical protein
MKLFIGTVNIASQLNDWKFGFESNGCNVAIGSYGNHSNIIKGTYDILITRKGNYKLPLIRSYTLDRIINNYLFKENKDYRRKLLKKLVKEYDVFFFIWSSVLDGYEDFEIIKDAGKKIIVQHVGDDVRWAPAATQEFEIWGFRPIEYDNYNYNTDNLESRLGFLRMSEKYADLIYSRPNQAQLGLRNYGVNPYIVKYADFEERSNQRVLPKVVHFPSSSSFKGTKYVLEAVSQLQRSGIAFEFHTTGDTIAYGSDSKTIPYESIVKIYEQCDILIGQVLCPGGGRQERELLASGKIVMSNMSPRYETHLPAENPIIDVNPENLAEKLKEIILDYDRRCDLAKVGRPYVEYHHNPVKVTARILQELESGAYKSATYQPNFFRNTFSPESQEHVAVYNKWTAFVKDEPWYKQSIISGERDGLIF